MLCKLSLAGFSLMVIALVSVPFSNTMVAIFPLYVSGLLFYTLMFLLGKQSCMLKYILFGLYLLFSVVFMFAIYLSIFLSPDMRATILLGAFCIMPLSFIDRPSHMNLFVFFWFLVHTALAFYLKSRYALDDTINSLCFAFLGCYIGNSTIRVRLQSYEAHRLLIIEKETDILTGLFNRRKLFETLTVLKNSHARKPSGILMLDIDHFKEFNDMYGHVAGDRCLTLFGETLKRFTQTFRLEFYRYGGEEFVAIAYQYDEEELLPIAESIRIAVKDTDMDGQRITVSIGVSYCGDDQDPIYENVINQADSATYMAKRTGRNKVCLAQNDIQVP
ncbi:MAG: GGDEF domain-containing protein [Sphaerochaeta sp.]|nr:GGDEF domain-containing protein [Sphaerochaeta sp.]